jgi:hypothetical protein
MQLVAALVFGCAYALSPRVTTRSRRGVIVASEGGGWSARHLVPELQTERTETPKGERVPWDWKRFLSQSSKFVELPSLPKKSEAARVLSPDDSFGELQLFPLDDVVMGGASASTFDNDSRRWTGEVTALNSGGFVGIRCKSIGPLDLSATTGVVLKVRPDGTERRFKFVLRDSTDFNGICWTASFTVGSPSLTSLVASVVGSDISESVHIPYDTLVPTIFAKTVPEVSLDLANVVGVQIALSTFEYDGGLNPLFS